MKALLMILALASTPALANETPAWANDVTDAIEARGGVHGPNGPWGRRFRCREGSTQYFSNDGWCSYGGGQRDTLRQCRNGRWIVIREYCYGGR